MKSIVTISSKQPLYKGDEEATRIELLNFVETGFTCVAQKDLYNVGDKVQYIEPDTVLPDIELFNDFIRPENGSSYLGNIEGVPLRVRAKKFNFSTSPGSNSIYSQGILLPMSVDLSNVTFTKYVPVEDRDTMVIGASSSFPSHWYKTDETNIMNKIGHIQFPITLVGTEKADGSSISFGWDNGEYVICSRNMRKPETYMKTVGMRKPTILERLRKFFTGYLPDLRIREETLNNDVFVENALKYKKRLTFRGELVGRTCKGSGNRNNQYKDVDNHIRAYGVDIDGVKQPYTSFIAACELYGIKPVDTLFIKKFNSLQEIIDACNEVFKERTMEGVVVRTLDSKFSAKVMSLEYDAKK